MLNRKTVRAARVRFVEALYKRHAVSGLRQGYDIALTISMRTGVPVAAIVATKGEDSLTWGSSRIKRHKAWADLRMVSGSDLTLKVD